MPIKAVKGLEPFVVVKSGMAGLYAQAKHSAFNLAGDLIRDRPAKAAYTRGKSSCGINHYEHKSDQKK